ncbi:hypothetical protein BH09BAC5_BH09BAC5_23240 [soil metagenome]
MFNVKQTMFNVQGKCNYEVKSALMSTKRADRYIRSKQCAGHERANGTVSFRGALFCLRFWASKKVRRQQKMKIVPVIKMVSKKLLQENTITK